MTLDESPPAATPEQKRIRRAQALAPDLPIDGWIPDAEKQSHAGDRRVRLLHPARPGVVLHVVKDSGVNLNGPTFDAWICFDDGPARVLSGSFLRERDLGQAAIEDLRWTYGPSGQAAHALARLMGAAWGAEATVVRLQIEIHRRTIPQGEMVLRSNGRERRRRLPGGKHGPLSRLIDRHAQLRTGMMIDTRAITGLSAHGRLAAAEEARTLAHACGFDAPTATQIMHRFLRDLAAAKTA